MPVSIDVGEIRLKGYAYYDQKREQQELNSFYKRLYDLMEVLKSKSLKPWDESWRSLQGDREKRRQVHRMECSRWQSSSII